MSLGIEVGLGPGDFVLDGDPAPPPQKGGRAPSPIVMPVSIVAKRLDASAYVKMPLDVEVGLSPGDFVLDGDPVL